MKMRQFILKMYLQIEIKTCLEEVDGTGMRAKDSISTSP